MKFETLMLQSLFAASLLVCLLTFGAMVTSNVNVATSVASHAPVAAVANSAG